MKNIDWIAILANAHNATMENNYEQVSARNIKFTIGLVFRGETVQCQQPKRATARILYLPDYCWEITPSIHNVVPMPISGGG